MVGLFLFPINIKAKGLIKIKKKNIIINLSTFLGLINIKINIFESNGLWYIQINKFDIKPLNGDSKYKMDFDLEKLPKIKLDKLYINIACNPDDDGVGLIVSFVRNVIDVIIPLLDPKIKIEDYRFNSVLKDSENEDVANFQIELKSSLIKILIYLMKNLKPSLNPA